MFQIWGPVKKYFVELLSIDNSSIICGMSCRTTMNISTTAKDRLNLRLSIPARGATTAEELCYWESEWRRKAVKSLGRIF